MRQFIPNSFIRVPCFNIAHEAEWKVRKCDRITVNFKKHPRTEPRRNIRLLDTMLEQGIELCYNSFSTEWLGLYMLFV